MLNKYYLSMTKWLPSRAICSQDDLYSYRINMCSVLKTDSNIKTKEVRAFAEIKIIFLVNRSCNYFSHSSR
jgi:hypothetical protein